MFVLGKEKSAASHGKKLCAVGATFGGLGAAGAFGACHAACQGLIAFLAIFGIVVVGMPLAFLQEPLFVVLFSAIGVVSVGASLYLYRKMNPQLTTAGLLRSPLVLFSLVVLALIVASSLLTAYSAAAGTGAPTSAFTQSPADIERCRPQPGYTEQSWREHMGHHPEIYKECLS